MRKAGFLLLALVAFGCRRTPSSGTGGPQADPVAVKVERLQAKDAATRQQAARSLANMGRDGAAAAPALLERLKDESPEVRREAAWALAKVGCKDKVIVPYLVDMLKDKSAEVRGTAIRTLGAIGPGADTAVPALIEVLEHGDQLGRKLAAEALGRMGPNAKAAVPALKQALKTEPVVRAPPGKRFDVSTRRQRTSRFGVEIWKTIQTCSTWWSAFKASKLVCGFPAGLI